MQQLFSSQDLYVEDLFEKGGLMMTKVLLQESEQDLKFPSLIVVRKNIVYVH